jgi:hypothetical protein
MRIKNQLANINRRQSIRGAVLRVVLSTARPVPLLRPSIGLRYPTHIPACQTARALPIRFFSDSKDPVQSEATLEAQASESGDKLADPETSPQIQTQNGSGGPRGTY